MHSQETKTCEITHVYVDTNTGKQLLCNKIHLLPRWLSLLQQRGEQRLQIFKHGLARYLAHTLAQSKCRAQEQVLWIFRAKWGMRPIRGGCDKTRVEVQEWVAIGSSSWSTTQGNQR